MNRCLHLSVALLFSFFSFGQVTFVIDSLPLNHDFNKDIYISGDFESWSGGDAKFKLNKNGSYYSITLPKLKADLSFKFTLGSWRNVECQLNNNPIENRSYKFNQEHDTVNIKIEKWSLENSIKLTSTASNNVHVFAENFYIPQLNRSRKISVYLPPNYNDSNVSFPVLYIQDGQNVFDFLTSYAGEWEVDETLNRLYQDDKFSLIVVAINHGDSKRLNEYSPWPNLKYGIAEGEEYINFIVNTLKPIIDKTYKTKKTSKYTAIMGSSMGGLISHYAALKYPNVFSKAGVFSPSFWYSNQVYNFTESHLNSKQLKMYFLVGGNEGEGVVEDVERMVDLMRLNKFPYKNVKTKVVLEGTHSESFWKSEFEQAIKWLFY